MIAWTGFSASAFAALGRDKTNPSQAKESIAYLWLNIEVRTCASVDETSADTITNVYNYDVRGMWTNLTQTLGTGTNTSIGRACDAQGDLAAEVVSLNGTVESAWRAFHAAPVCG